MALKNYIKRIAILYAVALITYSPIIISNCRQACDSILEAILWLTKRILFQGPYGDLWFLTALFLAIPLTFVSTKYLGCKKTILISFVFYLPTILNTEYGALFSRCAFLKYFTILIAKVFGWYANGLTFGFFLCTIGMVFAFVPVKGPLKKNLFFLILSFVALFAEAYLVRYYQLCSGYWALFFLIPFCLYAMMVLIELPKSSFVLVFTTKTRILQEMSVLVFIFHMFFRDCLDSVLGSFEWYYFPLIRYSLVVVCTVLLSLLIIWLSHFYKFLQLLY